MAKSSGSKKSGISIEIPGRPPDDSGKGKSKPLSKEKSRVDNPKNNHSDPAKKSSTKTKSKEHSDEDPAQKGSSQDKLKENVEEINSKRSDPAAHSRTLTQSERYEARIMLYFCSRGVILEVMKYLLDEIFGGETRFPRNMSKLAAYGSSVAARIEGGTGYDLDSVDEYLLETMDVESSKFESWFS